MLLCAVVCRCVELCAVVYKYMQLSSVLCSYMQPINSFKSLPTDAMSSSDLINLFVNEFSHKSRRLFRPQRLKRLRALFGIKVLVINSSI